MQCTFRSTHLLLNFVSLVSSGKLSNSGVLARTCFSITSEDQTRVAWKATTRSKSCCLAYTQAYTSTLAREIPHYQLDMYRSETRWLESVPFQDLSVLL